MNTVLLTGRATKEATLTTTSTGKQVAKFSIAVDRLFVKGKDKEVDYFKIEAWGFWAEKASKIVKGIKVFVTGSLRLNSWVDKATGQKRYDVIVVASEVEPVWGAESNYPQANESSEPKIPEDMVNAGGKDEQTEVPF